MENRLLLKGEQQEMCRQEATTARRIVFAQHQLEDIRRFKADLKEGKIEFAFVGTISETHAFLKGVKDIMDSFSH